MKRLALKKCFRLGKQNTISHILNKPKLCLINLILQKEVFPLTPLSLLLNSKQDYLRNINFVLKKDLLLSFVINSLRLWLNTVHA